MPRTGQAPSAGGAPARSDAAEIAGRLRAATDLGAVQEIVRTAARALTGADGATFVLRDVDHCFYADEDAISPLWKGQRFPLTNCISGWSMLHAESVVVPDIAVDERIPVDCYRPTFVKSLAMVPVGAEKPVAAIGAYWARPHTASAREMAALEAVAEAAGEAIARIGLFGAASLPPLSGGEAAPTGPVERARAARSPAASAEREHIARDLHDTVLQRMFATGLRLQRLTGLADQPEVASALDEAVAEIDNTIRELRGVIFGLESGHDQLGGLAGEVLAVAAEAARTLGFKPEVTLEGSFGHVAGDTRSEITGALREMLSNVSRHARASRVRVECAAGPPLRLRVTDNGAGLPERVVAGSGLGNLSARAQSLGGTFAIGPARGGGTVAEWAIGHQA